MVPQSQSPSTNGRRDRMCSAIVHSTKILRVVQYVGGVYVPSPLVVCGKILHQQIHLENVEQSYICAGDVKSPGIRQGSVLYEAECYVDSNYVQSPLVRCPGSTDGIYGTCVRHCTQCLSGRSWVNYCWRVGLARHVSGRSWVNGHNAFSGVHLFARAARWGSAGGLIA